MDNNWPEWNQSYQEFFGDQAYLYRISWQYIQLLKTKTFNMVVVPEERTRDHRRPDDTSHFVAVVHKKWTETSKTKKQLPALFNTETAQKSDGLSWE